MTLLTFERHGAQFPPERELLTVHDDGSFALWRSYGAHAAGRFGGSLPADQLAPQIDAAAAAPPPAAGEMPPDASVEVVRLRDADEVELPADARGDGPWAELLATCRRIVKEELDQPVAAVAARLVEPATLRLEHVGTEPIRAELASLAVQLDRWHEGVQAASSLARPGDLGSVEASPGWSVDVALDAATLDGPGQVTARSTFVLVDAGVYVPVAITARRPGPAAG